MNKGEFHKTIHRVDLNKVEMWKAFDILKGEKDEKNI